MKRNISLILIIVMLLGFSASVLGEAKTLKWEDLPWEGRVDIFEGEMDLSLLDIKASDILGFDIFKDNKRANLPYNVNGTKISFVSELELNTDYSLRVITNSKYYNIKFKSSDLTDITETGNFMVVKIPAMPEKGFKWPYYLRIPINSYKDENKMNKRYLMVDMPNNGKSDLLGTEQWVKETLEKRTQQSVNTADQLWSPMLMPAYPRINSYYEIDNTSYLTYEHALDRETATLHLKNSDPKTKKIVAKAYADNNENIEDFLKLDEQIVAMFEHAVEYLNKYGHNVEDKMFLSGYSATGTFTDRFTALHPDKVKALASGGTLDDMILPLSTYKEENLIFPIGTHDYKEITGREFDLKAHNNVARLIYMGKDDDNNTVEKGYLDCYSEYERSLIVKLFGYDVLPRAKALTDLYGQSGGKGIFVLDVGVGHSTSREMSEYMTEFFKANRDSKNPVYPTPKNTKQLEHKTFK